MLLRKMKLVNFRQYKGENIIEFSIDSHRNVTVILGINTSGKTTLVQAFNWILYGKTNFDTQYYLNNIVKESMTINEEKNVLVSLELEHNGIIYFIERKQTYKCITKSDVRPTQYSIKMEYKQEDGQIKSIDGFEIESAINKILPEGLSQYFFFDGERISNISNKQDVAQSIKGLMGLDVLEYSREHLAKVGKIFTNNLDLEGDQNAKKAQIIIDTNQKKLKFINSEIESADTQLSFYQKQMDSLSQQLIESAESSKLQEEKLRLINQLKALQDQYQDSVYEFVMKFNEEPHSFFGLPLYNACAELLRKTDYASESIDGINSSAINEILNRGKCICGHDIVAGSKEEKQLLHEKTMMPPESIGTMIKNYNKTISLYINKGDEYDVKIARLYESMRRIKKNISSLNDNIEVLSQKLLDSPDSSKLEKDYRSIQESIRKINNRRDQNIQNKGICKKNIEDATRKFDSLVATNQKNKFLNVCREYTSNLYEWVSESYDKSEKDIRSRLEESVNSIFNKMYHGKRTIVIEKNYKVSYSDIKMDESGGLETVKNFAFIAGLVNLGREKLNQGKEDDYDLGGEPYPLVMDAPFSKADEIHVSNISKILPKIAQQVIMVIMKKDWDYAKKDLDEYIGEMYSIDKINETHSRIEKGMVQ